MPSSELSLKLSDHGPSGSAEYELDDELLLEDELLDDELLLEDELDDELDDDELEELNDEELDELLKDDELDRDELDEDELNDELDDDELDDDELDDDELASDGLISKPITPHGSFTVDMVPPVTVPGLAVGVQVCNPMPVSGVVADWIYSATASVQSPPDSPVALA